MANRISLSIALLLTACVAEAPIDTAGDPPPSGADQNVDNAVRITPSVSSSSSVWTGCSCGQNLGSLGGQAAYCNGGGGTTCAGLGPYGYRYQCVEFVNRYEEITRNKPRIYANAGTMFCDTASQTAGYTAWGPGYRSNSGHKPGVGDILVWNSDYGAGTGYPGHNAGHVAVVTGSDATHLFYIQQNWGWYVNAVWGQLASTSTGWNNSTSFFGAPGADINGTFHKPVCWVHPE